MLDRLWAEFQEQTQSYRKATEERKIRFEALKRKDEESAHTIARQMKKIQHLQVRTVWLLHTASVLLALCVGCNSRPEEKDGH